MNFVIIFFFTSLHICCFLDHAPGEDHIEEEEGSEGARAAPHLLLHAAHSLFPSILCSAGIKIVVSEVYMKFYQLKAKQLIFSFRHV